MSGYVTVLKMSSFALRGLNVWSQKIDLLPSGSNTHQVSTLSPKGISESGCDGLPSSGSLSSPLSRNVICMICFHTVIKLVKTEEDGLTKGLPNITISKCIWYKLLNVIHNSKKCRND